ncbi:MAG: CidA/LrgA family protein [Alistipes sp.]|nr:CidA/LrgA family protein [Alistipes sp.]
MLGLLVILLCWVLGNLLSFLIGGYISGNVLGMIILFVALKLHLVNAETVRPTAKFLLGSMALFFIPYGVGLMESYTVILDHIWAIVAAAVLSTIVVLLVTGLTFQWIAKLKRK